MFIKTPFYIGDAELCILWKPVTDLVIGQLNDIHKCTHQEIQAWNHRNGLASKTVSLGVESKIPRTWHNVKMVRLTQWQRGGETRQHEQRLLNEKTENNTVVNHYNSTGHGRTLQQERAVINEEMNGTQSDDKVNNRHSIPDAVDIMRPQDITIPFTASIPPTEQMGSGGEIIVRSQGILWIRLVTMKRSFLNEQKEDKTNQQRLQGTRLTKKHKHGNTSLHTYHKRWSTRGHRLTYTN